MFLPHVCHPAIAMGVKARTAGEVAAGLRAYGGSSEGFAWEATGLGVRALPPVDGVGPLGGVSRGAQCASGAAGHPALIVGDILPLG